MQPIFLLSTQRGIRLMHNMHSIFQLSTYPVPWIRDFGDGFIDWHWKQRRACSKSWYHDAASTPINTIAASRLADAYFCLICNLRQFYFVFHIFAKRYIICSERPMSVGETRKQPKLHFVFKPSTKLKLSQFDPLAVWLKIRDIYQRLNRDRVLGNFPKGVLCFMNSDIVWFSMPTQT